MRKLTIEVKKVDIRKGVPGSCERCPVALAIKRLVGMKKSLLFKEAGKCRVAFDVRFWYKGDVLSRFIFPTKVDRFIGRFDNHIPMKPFKFRLEEVYV